MATAVQKKKIERAYTVKNIESDDLEYVMINKLNIDIYSIDENDMSDGIKFPVGAKLHPSWSKGAELEKAFSKHSETVGLETRSIIRSTINELNGTVFRILTAKGERQSLSTYQIDVRHYRQEDFTKRRSM